MPKIIYSFIIHTTILFTAITWMMDICYAENSTHEYFIISSGALGGNYNKAGNILAESLNKINSERYTFKAVTSNGSVENMERLKDRFSDFAIVQRDIFMQNYYGDGDKIKNVSIISPLFQEKFLIYTHENSHISFNQFKSFVDSSPTAIKIGTTSLNGASYKTFNAISSLLGLNESNVEFVVGNYKALSDKFISNEIDCILTFSLPIKEISKAKKVYFDDTDIRLLTNRMHHLTTADIGEKKYQTLGVWTLFIGLNSSINQIGERAMIDSIHNVSGTATNTIERGINNTFNEFKLDDSLYRKYLKGLPVINSFQNTINKNNPEKNIYLKIILGISAIIIFSLLIHQYWESLWMKYKHALIGILLVSTIYALCVEFSILREKQFFHESGMKSNILDVTRLDLHLWNFVRIFANNDGGIFPISIMGKLAITLSTYIIWVGSISILITQWSMHKFIVKRREGLMRIKYKEHIIIAGWSDNTPKLIEGLLSACKEYHGKILKIVCVVPEPKSILEKHEYISNLEYRKELTLIKGYIRNRVTLEQCNAQQAKIIILLAEGTDVHADEKTLMRALAIRKFCCENGQNKEVSSYSPLETTITTNVTRLYEVEINSTYIIAQTNTEEFISDLRDAGVNGIINKNKIADGLLVQSILNPGVSKLVNNILTFGRDTNEFYTVDLLKPNNSHLRNRTFDELLLPLRKQNILLIAIKVVYRDQSGKEIANEDEISRLLKSEGLYRQIITNPITDVEKNRKTDDDDKLITLATSSDRLSAGLKLVEFQPGESLADS